jgi:hypothetical protein
MFHSSALNDPNCHSSSDSVDDQVWRTNPISQEIAQPVDRFQGKIQLQKGLKMGAMFQRRTAI